MQCSESHPKGQFGVSGFLLFRRLKRIGLNTYRTDALSSSADNSAIAESSAAAQKLNARIFNRFNWSAVCLCYSSNLHAG
jgi:hypothetical protein